MRLKPDILRNDLKKTLRPIYLVTGDEPLQMIECADGIRHVARQRGYTERQVFHVEQGFDWGQLLQEANSMSLFAEKKILELRLNSVKLGDSGSKALIEYCERISADNILIMTMPKLDKRSQNLKWFKAMDACGAVIQVWPVEVSRLPQWIMRRMKNCKLEVSRDAANLLAEKVEGNMLAAAQEIDKLALNAPATISVENILESSSDDAKFDVYKLVDAAIAGKYKRFSHILLGLKAGGEAPSLVLWALTREIRTMVAIAHDVSKGTPLGKVFSHHRIWDNRADLVKSAIKRYRSDEWMRLLSQAINVDQVIKGIRNGNVWDELLDLGFSVSGKKLLGSKV